MLKTKQNTASKIQFDYYYQYHWVIITKEVQQKVSKCFSDTEIKKYVDLQQKLLKMANQQLNELKSKLELIENKIDNFEFEHGELHNLKSQCDNLNNKINRYNNLKEILLYIDTSEELMIASDQKQLSKYYKMDVKKIRDGNILTKDECILLKHFLKIRRQFLSRLYDITQETVNMLWNIRNQKLTEWEQSTSKQLTVYSNILICVICVIFISFVLSFVLNVSESTKIVLIVIGILSRIIGGFLAGRSKPEDYEFFQKYGWPTYSKLYQTVYNTVYKEFNNLVGQHN
jgi:hypothetical protein